MAAVRDSRAPHAAYACAAVSQDPHVGTLILVQCCLRGRRRKMAARSVSERRERDATSTQPLGPRLGCLQLVAGWSCSCSVLYQLRVGEV